jgi:ABC-type polysaccharide transport system permease subunit
MADDPIYQEIRRRITKRYANRTEFFSHLISFVVVNLIVWSLLSGQLREWGLLVAVQLCAGLWFMGLLIHAAQFLLVDRTRTGLAHGYTLR